MTDMEILKEIVRVLDKNGEEIQLSSLCNEEEVSPYKRNDDIDLFGDLDDKGVETDDLDQSFIIEDAEDDEFFAPNGLDDEFDSDEI